MVNKINRVLSIYIGILTLMLLSMTVIFSLNSIDIKDLDQKITDVSSGWIYVSESGSQMIDWSETRHLMDQKKIVLSKVVDEDILRAQSLIFFDTNTNVNVFVNDVRVYHRGDLCEGTNRWEGIWDWHIIKLPYFVKAGDTLEIEICRISPKQYGVFPRMIVSADVDDFFDFILKKSFWGMMICLWTFIFAVMLICLWLIRRGWQKDHWISLNVALFALLATVAMSMRIPWINWVFNHSAALPLASSYFGLIAVLPVMCFTSRISGSYYRKYYRVIWIFANSYILARAILQMCGFSYLYLNYPYEYYLIFVLGSFYFAIVFFDFTRNRRDNLPNAHYLVIIFGGLALLFDIALVMSNHFYFSNTFFGLSALYGILYISFSSANALALTYQDSIDAKKYQMLSETDILTGLKNRNSYTKQIESLPLRNGLGVIIMDVNNLKSVNDRFGHQEGDKMIVQVAELIREAFNDNGFDSYRIGGDEFAVFAIDQSVDEIERRIWIFESMIRKLNDDRPYTVSVAVGYALYDDNSGGSIDDLVNRADQNMYLKKIAFKL